MLKVSTTTPRTSLSLATVIRLKAVFFRSFGCCHFTPIKKQSLFLSAGQVQVAPINDGIDTIALRTTDQIHLRSLDHDSRGAKLWSRPLPPGFLQYPLRASPRPLLGQELIAKHRHCLKICSVDCSWCTRAHQFPVFLLNALSSAGSWLLTTSSSSCLLFAFCLGSLTARRWIISCEIASSEKQRLDKSKLIVQNNGEQKKNCHPLMDGATPHDLTMSAANITDELRMVTWLHVF